MQIPCPNCGVMSWLENERRCHACSAVLRRCIDCINLERRTLHCRPLDFSMTQHQAEAPTMLSTSTNCPRYYPLVGDKAKAA